MPNEQNQGNVASSRLIGRRLSHQEKAHKTEVIEEEGRHRFLMNAFYDTRGSLSVDVFWVDNQLRAAAQQKLLEEMRNISLTEGHEIYGWAFCKVGNLLDKVGDSVSRVIHSPTVTNENHADIERQPFLQPESAADPHKSHKARNFAKVLTEFFNAHGRFVGSEEK